MPSTTSELGLRRPLLVVVIAALAAVVAVVLVTRGSGEPPAGPATLDTDPVDGDPTDAASTSTDGAADDDVLVAPVQPVELAPAAAGGDDAPREDETALDAMTLPPPTSADDVDAVAADAATDEPGAEAVTDAPLDGIEPDLGPGADEPSIAAEIAQLEVAAAAERADDEQILAELRADAAELAAAEAALEPNG